MHAAGGRRAQRRCLVRRGVAAALLLAAAPAMAEDSLTTAGKEALARGDTAAAVEWLRGGAEKDDPEAMFQLGLIHHRGRAVAKDEAAALNWMLEAGSREHLQAQAWLCAYHAASRLFSRATAWCRTAAERGDPLAQATLGRLYLDGTGAPRDYQQAYLWSVLAIAQLSPGPLRDRAVASRKAARQSMSSAERRDARRLIKEWRPTYRP